jgi:hypothetical protein
MKQSLGVAAATLLSFGLQHPASGSVLTLEAPRLFEQSVTQHLRLSEDETAVELESGELFEDDGPAAGHSYQQPRNEELLTQDTWIKKDIIIPNPEARAAFLVVLSEGPFQATVNGMPQSLGLNESGRQSYKTYPLDPKTLKAGRNEIVLRGSGKVLIARDDEFPLGSRTRTHHPNRGAKSTDAGRALSPRESPPPCTSTARTPTSNRIISGIPEQERRGGLRTETTINNTYDFGAMPTNTPRTVTP